MKTLSIVRTIFVIASVAAGCVSIPAHAQTAPSVTVNVPFGFEIGSRHLPAGKYTVKESTPDIVSISNRSDSAMLLTYDGQSRHATKNSKLVFDRYGDRYFLHQVWFNPNDNMYVQCNESKAEKQAKRAELEAATKHASNVEVAALRIP